MRCTYCGCALDLDPGDECDYCGTVMVRPTRKMDILVAYFYQSQTKSDKNGVGLWRTVHDEATARLMDRQGYRVKKVVADMIHS